MKVRSSNLAKQLLFVALIIIKICQADDDYVDNNDIWLQFLQHQNQKAACKLSDHLVQASLEDESVMQELWAVGGNLYNKMIETTALYFSGMFIDSNHFYRQIIFELGKHLLYIGKILGLYIPKLLNNPKISWKLKVKRCTYAASFLIVMVVWMQEFYRPAQQQGNLHAFRTIHKSYINDRDLGSLDFSTNVLPRQHPSLF